MSTPKITAKELAENLAGIYGDINDYDWPTVARRAAELLGVDLAPEKPEAGTYRGLFGAVLDRPVLVDRDANIYYLNDEGELIEGAIHTKGEFDGLVPARVVTTDPPVLTEEEVDRLWHEETGLGRASAGVVGVVRRALAKHGGARELPGVDTLAQTMKDAYQAGPIGGSQWIRAAEAVRVLLRDGDRG